MARSKRPQSPTTNGPIGGRTFALRAVLVEVPVSHRVGQSLATRGLCIYATVYVKSKIWGNSGLVFVQIFPELMVFARPAALKLQRPACLQALIQAPVGHMIIGGGRPGAIRRGTKK